MTLHSLTSDVCYMKHLVSNKDIIVVKDTGKKILYLSNCCISHALATSI